MKIPKSRPMPLSVDVLGPAAIAGVSCKRLKRILGRDVAQKNDQTRIASLQKMKSTYDSNTPSALDPGPRGRVVWPAHLELPCKPLTLYGYLLPRCSKAVCPRLPAR